MVLTHDRPSSGFDVSLVRRACAGDYEAFTALMERHGDPVRRLVRRFVRDGDDARDVEQDTWIRAASNLGSLSDAARFQPWVKAIARNTSLNYLSSRKRLGARVTTFEVLGTDDFEDAASPTPEAAVLTKDSQQKVWQALGTLSDRDRTALFLREYQGLPYSEIAVELGVSRNAAEVCAHRARERFRLAFTNVDAEVPECGVDGLRLSTLLEPAESDPLAARLELESHLASCGDCTRRLAAMTEGRALSRKLGAFGLPLPGAGLFGWVGDLLAKLGHLLGLTAGGGAATGAAGVSATAGAAAATGSTATAAGIGSAIVGTVIATTAAASIVAGAVLPALGTQPPTAVTAVAGETATAVDSNTIAARSRPIDAPVLPHRDAPLRAGDADVADDVSPAAATLAPLEEFAAAHPGAGQGVTVSPPASGGAGISIPAAPVVAPMAPTSSPAEAPDPPAPVHPQPPSNSTPADAGAPAAAPPASLPAQAQGPTSSPLAAKTVRGEQERAGSTSSAARPPLEATSQASPAPVLVMVTTGPPGKGPQGAGPAGKGPNGDGPPGVGPAGVAPSAVARAMVAQEPPAAASADGPSDPAAGRRSGR